MTTPYELKALADLRRRGQSPAMAVWITDDWRWSESFQNEIGCLCIRVRGPGDYQHDWSPLSGLWAILKLRRAQPSQVADFALAILDANPSNFWTMIDGKSRALL